jgi:hypothetical protein
VSAAAEAAFVAGATGVSAAAAEAEADLRGIVVGIHNIVR